MLVRVIGVTGGIGSGKSVVAAHLRRAGYAVCDADEIAQEAARPGEPALRALADAFGADILLADGGLDRRALADKVFGDAAKVGTLNRIMHGEIGRRIAARLREYGQVLAARREGRKPLFLVAPLLFEAGLAEHCEEVWLIAADEGLRARRASARDGVDEDRIRARMAHQMPEAEKRERADRVIENDGSVKELFVRTDRALASFLGKP
jgi:dephospho-CoA kinase